MALMMKNQQEKKKKEKKVETKKQKATYRKRKGERNYLVLRLELNTEWIILALQVYMSLQSEAMLSLFAG